MTYPEPSCWTVAVMFAASLQFQDFEAFELARSSVESQKANSDANEGPYQDPRIQGIQGIYLFSHQAQDFGQGPVEASLILDTVVEEPVFEADSAMNGALSGIASKFKSVLPVPTRFELLHQSVEPALFTATKPGLCH